jgi:G8 domain
MHGIPDFCANASIKSVANGNWSSAATWSPARVPAPGDRVSVLHTVTYDVLSGPQSPLTSVIPGAVLSSGPLPCVEVKGALRFKTSVNTRMWVGTLMVYETGQLEVGTPAAPIAAGVSAEIVIADQPLDTAKDPEQFGTGLIGLGKVTISGSPRTPYVRLASEVLAGSTLLATASPVSGWQAGDKLVLPDTRQLPGAGGYTPQWEELTALLPAGSAIALATPVKYFHEGARDGNGVLNFFPHVGNLTRNVIIRSANPTGTRGHVLFATRAEVDVRYVRLKDLGRTAATPLDNTKFDSTGKVTKVGANQIGRYPMHMHHVMGSTVPSIDGYQFRLVGNAVEGSKKWGVAIHNSHYGWIQGNIVYGVDGGGIVTEDGSESYNVIERNFVMRVVGSGGRGEERTMADLGWEGTGFWLRGTNNTLRDNIAADVLNDFGYKYFPYFVGNVKVPNFPGADPLVSTQFTTVSGNALPIREFSRNEAYGAMRGGLTYWWLGMLGNNTPVANPRPSVVKDFRVWHAWNWGVMHYPAAQLTFDGLIVRGKINTNWGTVGWAGLDYAARNVMIKSSDIQGMMYGIVPSTANAGGIQQFQDSYLRNSVNVLINTLWTSASEARTITPRTVVLRNVRFDVPTFNRIPTRAIQMTFSSGPVRNVVQKDDVFVYAFNGVATDNFKLFYPQQSANFLVPQTMISPYNTHFVEAAPQAGMSNQLAKSTYGLSIGGSIAPCATTRPNILGLVCQ